MAQSSRHTNAAAIAAAVGLAGFLACGTDTPKDGDDLGLVQVLSVTQGTVGPYDTGKCQIDVDVTAVLPHCGAWGAIKGGALEGNAFHFEQHAAYNSFACSYGPGSYQDSAGYCMPGTGQTAPASPLPPGTYSMVVNGVTGTFTVP